MLPVRAARLEACHSSSRWSHSPSGEAGSINNAFTPTRRAMSAAKTAARLLRRFTDRRTCRLRIRDPAGCLRVRVGSRAQGR